MNIPSPEQIARRDRRYIEAKPPKGA